MKVAAALTIALFLCSAGAEAKGGHGGGHGSGHGGHAASHAAKATSSSPHRTGTSSPAARPRSGVGQPANTAIPRPPAAPLPVSSPGGAGLLPSRPLGGSFGGSVGFAFISSPWWPVAPVDVGAPASVLTGGLRIEVEPDTAQVFVDGAYAGIVADYNGRFHHLDLEAGPHHVEIRRTGYDVLAVDVVIQPHYTISYRGTLVPSAR